MTRAAIGEWIFASREIDPSLRDLRIAADRRAIDDEQLSVLDEQLSVLSLSLCVYVCVGAPRYLDFFLVKVCLSQNRWTYPSK